ncbi:hypothetical protein V3C99_001210 [Haemonchus contortus]
MEHDHLNPKGDYIDEINKKSKIDEKLFQGDIYLDELQGKIIIDELKEELEGINRTKRQAIRDKEGVRLWSNHTVHYFVTTTLSEDARRAFLRGAEMWSKDTCIVFREDPSAAAHDLLVVQAKNGCWSNLGKLGSLQHISLADGCETSSIAAHEIGHTLGFYHTMSRHDRDKYVFVNLANIEEKWLSQFAWQREEDNDNFNLGYDYGSIMHYRASDAAINRQQPTLMPYDKYYRETLGSPFVSFIDVLMLNKLYGCDISKDEPRSTTLGSETRRITQPPTTFAPPPPVQKNKCEDRPECPIHIANGFCYHKGITYEQRKTYCPRGCHLCGSRGF